MARSPGRDEANMPVFDADSAGGDDRAARVPGAPGGHPGRQGRSSGVGMAVAALVVLTAGVALGGIIETGVPTGSQTPSHPVATPPACAPVATNVVPGFTIAVVGADPGFAGLAGYSRLPSEETLGHAWRVPAFDPGRDPPAIGAGAALEIRASEGACIRHLVADAAPATLGHVPDQSERIVLRGGPEDPPTAAPPLGSLPAGDWVIRVVAQFETGVSGPGGLVIGERFFRIRVGPGPYPTPTPTPRPTAEPTPRVTPAALCGPVPTDASLLEVQLSAPGVAGVAGAHEFGEPPDVSIGLGDTAELTIVGAACATSWTIATLTANGETYDSEQFENPGQDPDYAAQNRWNVRVPVGEHRLVATLRFGPDLEVSREWRVIGLDFTVPETFLVGANGSRVLALPGCGLTLELANGYSVSGGCGSVGYPEGLEVLRVPAWSRVVLEIPGWTISSWNGSCGRVSVDNIGNQYFDLVAECFLGGYSVQLGVPLPAPAQFLARPGELVIALYVNATRDGDMFSVPMFAIVAGE